MAEKDVNFYRNIAMKFIETNKTDLVKIYIQHSRTVPDEDKNAVLAFNLCEMETNNTIDVAFIPTKLLPVDMAEKVLDYMYSIIIEICYNEKHGNCQVKLQVVENEKHNIFLSSMTREFSRAQYHNVSCHNLGKVISFVKNGKSMSNNRYFGEN